VLTNLLNNACRYLPADGRVAVELSRTTDEAVISVRDDGIGISPELLSRVFDMFVQLGSPPDGQYSLGIGLTLVRSLVELHGGRVEARSEGRGRGSEFVVYLPLSRDGTPERLPRREEAETSRSDVRSIRTLVVDDNRDAADSIVALLEANGHEARVAYSGAAALEVLATYVPDLALIDLGMPTMDGYELARRVRRTPRLAYMRLVALTGWGQPEARERSRAAGFDKHVVKPLKASDLDELIVLSAHGSHD
jgi:CheY-like chemotaxis protein